jgi:uncharacterized protein (DUF305 family)
MAVTRYKTLTIGVAAATALVTLTACSNTSSNQATRTTSATSASAPAAAAHNQEDVMFAQHMIPHHQQAIQMSDLVLGKQGIDARVVNLANQIKAAQGPEIQQMQSWLSQWGQPTMPMMPSMMPSQTMMPGPGMTPGEGTVSNPPTDTHHTGAPTETATPGPGGMPGMPGMMPSSSMMPSPSAMPPMSGMSGMMSEQDMAALQNAQGVDASRLFLTQMIQHHQGAITMAQHEIDAGQYSAAVALAHSIVTSQQQEITTMQGILGSL